MQKRKSTPKEMSKTSAEITKSEPTSGGKTEDSSSRNQGDLIFLKDRVQKIFEFDGTQPFETPREGCSNVESFVDVLVDVCVLDGIGRDFGNPVDGGRKNLGGNRIR